jgi:hypothetical protein
MYIARDVTGSRRGTAPVCARRLTFSTVLVTEEVVLGQARVAEKCSGFFSFLCSYRSRVPCEFDRVSGGQNSDKKKKVGMPRQLARLGQ